MAMAWIWSGMLLLAVLAAAISGQLGAVSAAAMAGAERGAQLCLSLAGPLCLWAGLAAVLEGSGLSAKLAALLRPLLGRLFPAAARDAQALEKISGNFTANLLGLGNAATPLGIAAVQRMHRLSGGAAASDEMCRLIVLNTASIQLLPTTVAALCASAGAARPFAILPAVWLTSLGSVTVGLLAVELFARWWR